MKKIISLLLALSLLVCFAGCKEKEIQKEDENEKDLYNLSTYLQNGEIPEAEFKLGTSVQYIKDTYSEMEPDEAEHGHYHPEIYEIEGNRSVCLQIGEIMYYYEKGTDTVSSIVCLVNGFGFEVSELTGKTDVIKAFPSYKYTEREATNSELYFIPSEMENCTVITYIEGNRRLDFFFQEDNLIGINLVDTEKWTLT